MAVSLTKGNNVSLTKEVAGVPGAAALSAVTVGLGWDVRTTDGAEFDLDAVAVVVDASGRAVDDGFVFFNNLSGVNGAVRHTGDNLTGEGQNDDEQIQVDLSALPGSAVKVVFAVVIFKAEERSQTFGQVRGAFVRAVNSADGVELARFDLSEDVSSSTAMIFAELYLHSTEWKFKAVGDGYSGGLDALVKEYHIAL